MNRTVLALLTAGLVMGSAGAASAQVFTPTYQAPRPSNDFGIYLADGPGEFSAEAVLRRNFGGYDLGLRGGIADTDDASALLGLDLRSPIAAGAAPLDFSLTGGVQAVIGDVTALGLQGGLSIGHTFTPQGGLSITPYVHPRVGLIDGGGPESDFEVDLLADLGFDVRMTSGLVLRFGVALTDPGADWGIGLAWR